MKRTFSYKLSIFIFLLPALILFLGILIAPIVMSVIYSLNDFKAISGADMNFVGLKNYIELFSPQLVNEKGALYTNVNYMGDALVNSLILGFFSVFIQLPIALLIALKLSKGIRGERAYLSIFFMPVLISTVIIGRLWMNIYETNGLLNSALDALGIKNQVFSWISARITSTKMPFQGGWTGYKETALFAAFIPILWQYVGYHMLLMYAGIKGVPMDLLEAENRTHSVYGGAVIACGISDYVPGEDTKFSDVFVRADAQMYENKNLLKQQGPFPGTM